MIAFDALTVDSELANVATHSFSHVPVGTPSVAIVILIAMGGSSVEGADVDGTPTYGGQAMTLAVSRKNANAERAVFVYYLNAPPSGSQSVSIAATTGSSQLKHRAYALTYTGTEAGSPIDATATDTDLNSSVTTVTNGALVIDAAATMSSIAVTPDGSQTSRENRTGTTPDRSYLISEKTAPAAGSVTLSWAASVTAAHVLVALKPTSIVDVTVSPSGQALAASTPAAAVSGDASVPVATLSAAFSFLPATFSNVTNAVISASVQVLTASVPAITITGTALVTVATQTLTFATNAASFSLDAVMTAGVQVLAFATNILQRVGGVYQDKYTPRGSSYSNKLSTRGTSYTDKYTTRDS